MFPRKLFVVLAAVSALGCGAHNSESRRAVEIFDGCVISLGSTFSSAAKWGQGLKLQFADGSDSVLSAPTSEILKFEDGLKNKSNTSNGDPILWRGARLEVKKVTERDFAPSYFYVFMVKEKRSIVISQTDRSTRRLDQIAMACKP